jgi:hypothetical protein
MVKSISVKFYPREKKKPAWQRAFRIAAMAASLKSVFTKIKWIWTFVLRVARLMAQKLLTDYILDKKYADSITEKKSGAM